MPAFDQRQYVQLKSRLTRATNSRQPGKIIDEVLAAMEVFDATGYPDDWSRWMRAGEDALAVASRQLRSY